MIRRLSEICGLFAAFVLCSGVSADEVFTGNTEGGAFYAIIVPTVWNGDLVIWNHGYQFGPIGPVNPSLNPMVSGMGPLAPVQLAEG